MSGVYVSSILFDESIAEKGRVYWTIWHEVYGKLADPETVEQMTLARCQEGARLYPWSQWIAKKDDRIVGFCDFDLYHGEIFSIGVLPEYRGQGVARRLMEEILERLSAFDPITLWAPEKDPNAIRFYEHFGFRPCPDDHHVDCLMPVSALTMRLWHSPNDTQSN